jgi:hypothetical protein
MDSLTEDRVVQYSNNANQQSELYVCKIILSDDSSLILQQINLHIIVSRHIEFSGEAGSDARQQLQAAQVLETK